MKELIPILLGLGAFTMVGWVVHVIVDGYRRRQRLNVFTDFHGKLMDRMGSAKELGDFLQSEGGQQFLETLTVEKDHPANRILRAVQTGLVLLCLGAGAVRRQQLRAVGDGRRVHGRRHAVHDRRFRLPAVGDGVLRAVAEARAVQRVATGGGTAVTSARAPWRM